MTLPTKLTLVSDGISRVAVCRDPGTKPLDAVIWLHGGNGEAYRFLEGVRVRPNVIDIAPQGLITGDSPGWAHPWEDEDDLPEEAPDNLIDMRFMGALEQQIRTTFPSVTRVWLSGFSAGGGVVWATWGTFSSIWGTAITIREKFAGLCTVGRQLHKVKGSWDWESLDKTPIPFVMIHGSDDKPDLEENEEEYSWEGSYAQARSVNGNTRNSPEADRLVKCDERGFNVRLKLASRGKAPTARYLVENMGHEWVHAPCHHTDDLIIERFSAYGLGSKIVA